MPSTVALKAAVATAMAISALLVPAVGSAFAASQGPGEGTVAAAASSFDATCRSHSRTYVLRKYYRGPEAFMFRRGTSTWGWKHVKARHGWNSTMDRTINAALWSGDANGRSGFSTYLNQCPRVAKYRTIIGTPAGTNDLLTTDKVNQTAVASAPRCLKQVRGRGTRQEGWSDHGRRDTSQASTKQFLRDC